MVIKTKDNTTDKTLVDKVVDKIGTDNDEKTGLINCFKQIIFNFFFLHKSIHTFLKYKKQQLC